MVIQIWSTIVQYAYHFRQLITNLRFRKINYFSCSSCSCLCRLLYCFMIHFKLPISKTKNNDQWVNISITFHSTSISFHFHFIQLFHTCNSFSNVSNKTKLNSFEIKSNILDDKRYSPYHIVLTFWKHSLNNTGFFYSIFNWWDSDSESIGNVSFQ